MEATRDLELGGSQKLSSGTLHGTQSEAQNSSTAGTNERQPRHDGLYAQILEYRQADGQEPNEFYESYDVEKIAVKGLPYVAAFHANYPNTRTCREFRLITQRLTALYQSQLTCLLGALIDLDVEGATINGTQDQTSSQLVPFNKEKFITRCSLSPDQLSLVQPPKTDDGYMENEEQKKDRIDTMRENIIANMERIFDKYCIRVNWQYELRKFPRTSATTHQRVFKLLQSISGLNSDALDYLRAEDDFIYADADTLYERFHTFLIYIRVAFVKIARLFSCRKLFADEEAPFGKGPYNARRLRLMVKCLMVIAGSALVLTPVGILYLGLPPKGISFLIVALFGLVFAFTLIAFDNRMSHVLLGLAAYYAVLVVFLSISS
ncbi:hypothetical protein SAMD00023353_0403540 [Rosellinia necatrix]|uniref:DUF6594 domain-containing protein n=1 Tax=Rosellinia necatrix TaxID=77044 RepID=A0A1S7UJA7_ROSNE|nr:hypothetical protein SAMD00023353_0403540 [Rosellinia necatrix]